MARGRPGDEKRQLRGQVAGIDARMRPNGGDNGQRMNLDSTSVLGLNIGVGAAA